MTGRRDPGNAKGSQVNEFHDHVTARVGERIRRRRRAIDLTQEELAFRAATHRTQITLIEHGRRLPRIDMLLRLAAGLEVSPCQLLAGIDWKLVGGGEATAEEDA